MCDIPPQPLPLPPTAIPAVAEWIESLNLLAHTWSATFAGNDCNTGLLAHQETLGAHMAQRLHTYISTRTNYWPEPRVHCNTLQLPATHIRAYTHILLARA